MKKARQNTGVVLISLMVVVSLSGCDQVNKIREYFSPKKPATAVAQKAAPSAAPSSAMPADAVVRVGSWSLTKEQFAQRLEAVKQMAPDFDPANKDQRRLVLDQLVQQRLLVQEALEKKMDADPVVREAVEEFRNSVLAQQLVVSLIEKIEVSDDEAKATYEQYKDNFTDPGKVRVSEILVATEAEAKEISAALLAGGDFAALAQQRSKAASAAKGGDLGLKAYDELASQKMAQIVFTLDVGKFSQYFEGPDGFYIVKLNERQEGAVQPFESVKDQIKEAVLANKQEQTVVQHLDGLRANANIQINEALLGE